MTSPAVRSDPSLGCAVMTTCLGGLVRSMSAAAERLTGWSAAEAGGKPLKEVLCFADAATDDVVDALRSGGSVAELSHSARVIARDGTERLIACCAEPIRDDGGAAAGVVLILRDVNEEHEARRALRESERRLRTIIETEPECVKVVDRDGRILEMNAAGLAMLEAESLAEVLPRTSSISSCPNAALPSAPFMNA